jgi:hypothetical protein
MMNKNKINSFNVNTLDRELSTRSNISSRSLNDRNFSDDNFKTNNMIQSNEINSSNDSEEELINRIHNQNNKKPESKKLESKKTELKDNSRQVAKRPISKQQNIEHFEKEISIKAPIKLESTKDFKPNENKIKYITTDRNDFRDFYSFGNKMGQNYNTDQESDLYNGIDTRRKSIKDERLQNLSKLEKKVKNQNENITHLDMINTESIFKMNISGNGIPDSAAKLTKVSSEYWDNTKRRNLDTATYTDPPSKISGRGFGEIEKYGLFMNGIGITTRQDNPDLNPRNVDDDRIFLTNQNYNYDKFHVPGSLPCGDDTRAINKKIL